MPDLSRLLSKFGRKERKILESLIEKVISLQWHGLDIKKLTGYEDIYRVRKGNLRIIFRIKSKIIFILAIERRTEKTYKI